VKNHNREKREKTSAHMARKEKKKDSPDKRKDCARAEKILVSSDKVHRVDKKAEYLPDPKTGGLKKPSP